MPLTQYSGHGRSTCFPSIPPAPAAEGRLSLPHVLSLSWCWDDAGAVLRHLAASLAGVLPVQDVFGPPHGSGLLLVPSFCGS